MDRFITGLKGAFSLKRYSVLICLFLSLALLNACDDGGSDSVTPIVEPSTGNYSQMTWVEAYDGLHKQVSEQYAFGEWKSIDWGKLNALARPKVVQSMENNDEAAYATAILEYTKSLPDGHVSTTGGKLMAMSMEHINGSYGFGIIGLDDGRVIANIVTEGGQADTAGMEVGDELLEWNSVPVADALEQISTLWRLDSASLATDEHRRIEKYRMLVLDPIDVQTEVTFLKSDGSGRRTAKLTSQSDNGIIFNQTELWKKVDDYNPIQYKVLDSGYGYILLGALESETISIKTLSAKLKEAMESLTGQNVPGIIVDLRGNSGGSDDLVAEFAGYFYSETTFYEYQSYYNTLTGEFEIVYVAEDGTRTRDIPLNIEPQTLQYDGPVVALVNPLSISSAEGVAMTIQNLSQGSVVGFWGTNGSFGMTGGKALLPGDYTVSFPFGRSIDINEIIQLDSQGGIGGVVPDARVPMTLENAARLGAGDDVELDYAVNLLEQL